MYKNQNLIDDEFTQFYNDLEVEEQLKTPINMKSNRFRNTPSTSSTTKLSLSDLEKTMVNMTPRMEILLKKEKKILEDESNYTFKPTINKSSTRHSSNQSKHGTPNNNRNGGDSRFDHLYGDALKRHLEHKWKENLIDKDLTFKPKINRSRANSSTNSRSGSPKSNGDQSSVATKSSIDRLHHHSTGKIKHTTTTTEELTFKPEITKRAQSIDRKVSADRLFHTNHGLIEQYKAQERFKLSKEKEIENCTFHPRIKTIVNNTTTQQLDINQRMEKFQESRDKKIEEAKRIKEAEEQMENTFKPTFKSKRSNTPLAPFHERLSQSIAEKHVSEQIQQEAYAELTFKPKLISKRSISPNGRASEYSTVYERLFHEGEERRKEAEVERKQMIIEQQSILTFTPELCKKTIQTVEQLRAEGGLPNEPVHERLATGASKQYMQDVLMKVKAELELRECTFQPKLIADGSKYQTNAIKEINVHERLNNEADNRSTEKLKLEQKKIENELEGSTFAPKLPNNSIKIVRSLSMYNEAGDDGSVSVMSRSSDTFNRLYSTQTLARATSPSPLALQDDNNIRGSISQQSSFYGMKYENLVRESSVSPTTRRMSTADINNSIDRLHNKSTKNKLAPNVDYKHVVDIQDVLRSSAVSLDSTLDKCHHDDESISPTATSTIGRRASVIEIDEIVDRLHKIQTKSKSTENIETRQLVDIETILRSPNQSNTHSRSTTPTTIISQPEVKILRRDSKAFSTSSSPASTPKNNSSSSSSSFNQSSSKFPFQTSSIDGLFEKAVENEVHNLPPPIKQSNEVVNITNKNGIPNNKESNTINITIKNNSSNHSPTNASTSSLSVPPPIIPQPSKPVFLKQNTQQMNDFSSKIDASMQMLKLKPSEIVAMQKANSQKKQEQSF